VIDTKKEHIAVTEANKLGMPIVAVVDTNCDPDVITYVIPGNDDAIRSGALMCRVLAEAVIEGRWVAEHQRAVAPPVPTTPPGRGQLRRAGAGTSGTLDPTPPGSVEAQAAAAAAAPEPDAMVGAGASPTAPEPTATGTEPTVGGGTATATATAVIPDQADEAAETAAAPPAASEPAVAESPAVDGPSEVG
jgi:small subunit ribosomal protein S2